jgi:tetratricopeptide (TPR) repeat protein
VDFTSVLDINPKDAFTYGRRGVVYRFKGDYDRAIADFTKQLEIDPENPDVYRSRSLAYADRRDNVSALADYNKAIELTRHRIEAGNSQPN